MAKMVFINLPVADVAASTAFYEALGAPRDPRFCDGSGSMVSFSDSIKVMLLGHDRFRDFTPKAISDARTTSEVLIALSADSRADVDAMVERARAAGGVADPCAQQEHGFMYGRSFEDLDGHIWEVAWMDIDAAMAARTPANADA
jgi:predicted lactoylglutathione lyase